MISELRITDPSRTCIQWWETVPFLQGKTSIEFKPGLNILWGPNGSGKSTVLSCIARMLHAEQGSYTCPTDRSVNELFPISGDRDDDVEGYTNGAVPIHDGQVIQHFDPMHMIGLSCGGAAFDWDFSEGLGTSMFKGSSGQTTLARFSKILESLVTRKWPEANFKANGVPSKDTELPPKTSGWRNVRERRTWLVTNTLKGTIPVGPRTILLDEPDRSLDLPYQWRIWDRFAQEKGIQIIAASHSLVALGIKDAHYIEFAEGYLAKSERVMDLLVQRSLLEMEGLKKETEIDILTHMLSKLSQKKGPPPRDPRTDPQEGDMVRVPWKGGMQIRVITEIDEHPLGGIRVKWAHTNHPNKRGGAVSLRNWKKITKGCTVLRAGTPE